MLNSLFLAIRFLILIFSGHKHVALENIALRHQLAVHAGEKATTSAQSGSMVLDRAKETLEGLENCARIRSA